MASVSRNAYKQQLKTLDAQRRETLYDMLLGDAHVRYKRKCRDASVEFVHGLPQQPFVDHLHADFRPYTWMATPRTSVVYRADGIVRRATYRFSTFTHPLFTAIHRVFYTYDAQRQRYHKHIPADVDRWLMQRVLVYHVMCDGSLDRGSLTLATHGFSSTECVRYVEAVNRVFGVHGVVREHRVAGRVYSRVHFPVRDCAVFQGVLAPYMVPMFAYKLGLSEADVGTGSCPYRGV